MNNAKGLTIVSAALMAMLSVSAQAQQADPTSAVPRNWRETLNVLNGEGAAADAAKAMRDEAIAARDPKLAGASPASDAMANARLDGAATKSGINAAMIDAGEDRETRLKMIEKGLDVAEDGDDLAELNARAQIENGRMLNELLKLQAANQLIDTKTMTVLDEAERSGSLEFDYGTSRR